jgi:hypothetical protein
MTVKSEIINKPVEWGVPIGALFGVTALAYIYINKENLGELISFKFIFFPMLATIGVAALANFIFYLATGHSPKKSSSGGPTNEELLSRAAQSSDRVWMIMCYRLLQPIAMIGAGYITTCPIIGILLLK